MGKNAIQYNSLIKKVISNKDELLAYDFSKRGSVILKGDIYLTDSRHQDYVLSKINKTHIEGDNCRLFICSISKPLFRINKAKIRDIEIHSKYDNIHCNNFILSTINDGEIYKINIQSIVQANISEWQTVKSSLVRVNNGTMKSINMNLDIEAMIKTNIYKAKFSGIAITNNGLISKVKSRVSYRRNLVSNNPCEEDLVSNIVIVNEHKGRIEEFTTSGTSEALSTSRCCIMNFGFISGFSSDSSNDSICLVLDDSGVIV